MLRLIAFVLVFNFSLLGYAKDFKAMDAIQAMLSSLDHIQTIQADVSEKKTFNNKTTKLNYKLTADDKGNIKVDFNQNNGFLARIFKNKKAVFIKNQRGFFVVEDGIASKQSQDFPFDLPHNFLRNLSIEDVSSDYKFVIMQEDAKSLTIEMVPIRAILDSRTSKLQFIINKPYYTLAQVKIFKDYKDQSFDSIIFEYDFASGNEASFEHKYQRAKNIFLAKTISNSIILRDEKEIKQIKETSYKNVLINQYIDIEVFNEELN